jgi:hypothetical protein
MHDVKMLDSLADRGLIEAGAFYVIDKTYVEFKRFYPLECAKAYFVTRANAICRDLRYGSDHQNKSKLNSDAARYLSTIGLNMFKTIQFPRRLG